MEDGATVPLYYDARGEKLGVDTEELNEKIAEKLDEFETGDFDVEQRLEHELRRDYHIVTAPDRLEAIAKDFVSHCTNAWESGKSMFVAIDKVTAVKMRGLAEKFWQSRLVELEESLSRATDTEERSTSEAADLLDEGNPDCRGSERRTGRGREVPQLGSR